MRALSLRKHVQTARVLFSSLTFRKRYYKYYARNRALRSTLFHARTGCDVQVTGTFDSNPLGHDTEYNGAGRGTRDELLCPPQKKKKKRCEKVYFVRRCVIRVITLTSLLPEREREKENSEKSKRRGGAEGVEERRRKRERERERERSRTVEPLLPANAGLLCIIKAMCRPGLLCRRPG